jgi:hypothetical protein
MTEKATKPIRILASTKERIDDIKAHQMKTRRKNDKTPTIADIIDSHIPKLKTKEK